MLIWQLGKQLKTLRLYLMARAQKKILKIRWSSSLQSSCPLLATTLIVVISFRSAGRLAEKLSLPL
jgi:hypothetical protein